MLIAHILGIPVEENLGVIAPAVIVGLAALIARLRRR
jgi:hypothetical protein